MSIEVPQINSSSLGLAWVNQTNQLADLLSTRTVTTSNTDYSVTNGNAFINGGLAANTLIVMSELRGGNTTSANTLYVTSPLDINSRLTVVGNASFQNASIVTLRSTGTAFANNMVVTGTANIFSISVQNVSVTGTLTAASLNIGTSLSVNGAISANTLLIIGESAHQGNAAFQTVNVSGTLNVNNTITSKDHTINGQVVVSANATFASAVSIGGNARLSGTFTGSANVAANGSITSSSGNVGTTKGDLFSYSNNPSDGMLFLGNSGTRYLQYTAVNTTYNMPNGHLAVGGNISANNVGINTLTARGAIQAGGLNVTGAINVRRVENAADGIITFGDTNARYMHFIGSESRLHLVAMNLSLDQGALFATAGANITGGVTVDNFTSSGIINVGGNLGAQNVYTRGEIAAATDMRAGGSIYSGNFVSGAIFNATGGYSGTAANGVYNFRVDNSSMNPDGTFIAYGLYMNTGSYNNSIYGFHKPGVTAGITLQVGTIGFTLTNAGNASAPGTWYDGSDGRVKEDREVISEPFEKLKKLTGYSYNRIDLNRRDTGLIAQEVQEVFPEAVNVGVAPPANDPDGTGFLSLNYNAVTALLVETNKALLEQNEKLMTQMKRMEARIKKLEKANG